LNRGRFLEAAWREDVAIVDRIVCLTQLPRPYLMGPAGHQVKTSDDKRGAMRWSGAVAVLSEPSGPAKDIGQNAVLDGRPKST